MMEYLILDIILKENIIMGDFAGKEDQAATLKYLSGSAIRGVAIYDLINNHNISEEEVLQNIIGNKVYFLNGYKIMSNERSIPTPLCFVADKTKQRIKENSQIINVLSSNIDRSDEQRVRIKVGEFINIKGKNLSSTPIHSRDFLHIKTSNKNFKNNSSLEDSETQMYRVETLSSNQVFRAFIATEDTNAIGMLEKVFIKNKVFYLGASRGNGYGRCELLNISKSNINPELKYLNEKFNNANKNKEFYILYTSDLIYINNQGRIQGLFDILHLNEHLNISCKFEGIATEPKIITGFNSKLGGRLPQYIGAKMGTIAKYSYVGELKEDTIIDFCNQSYGLRVEEGLGRVVILNNFDLDNVIFDIAQIDIKSETKINLDEAEKEFLLKIAKDIYLLRMKSIFLKNALHDNSFKLSATQISKWIKVFGKMKSLPREEGLSYYDNLNTHLNKTTNDKRKDKNRNFSEINVFNEITIGSWIKNSETITLLKKTNMLPSPVIIGGLTYEISDSQAYYWHMEYLELSFYHRRNKIAGGSK